MVIFSGFASILFSLLVIAFLEYAIKIQEQSTSTREKYEFIHNRLKDDFSKLLFWQNR